jgi:hypothetical protein
MRIRLNIQRLQERISLNVKIHDARNNCKNKTVKLLCAKEFAKTHNLINI